MEVGKQYADMYENYYSGNEVNIKREIAARQTLGHIVEVTDGRRFEKVLDIGAGNGSVLQELESSDICSEFSAVEISKSGVEAIRSRNLSRLKEVKLFDGYNIDFPDNSSDLGLAVHVLEHVEHERQFLMESARVCKHIYVEVHLEHTRYIDRSIRISGEFGHINFYTADTFRNILVTSGLQVEAMRVFYHDRDYEVLLSGRWKGEVKYQIRKHALALWPRLAMRHLVYMAGALCSTRPA